MLIYRYLRKSQLKRHKVNVHKQSPKAKDPLRAIKVIQDGISATQREPEEAQLTQSIAEIDGLPIIQNPDKETLKENDLQDLSMLPVFNPKSEPTETPSNFEPSIPSNPEPQLDAPTVLKTEPPDNDKAGKSTCAECKAVFRKPYDLKIHMRVHTGEKPFQVRRQKLSTPQNIL